jgi:hypothetical protein
MGSCPGRSANGSTGYSLKMFGDINGDGDMVYVGTCDPRGAQAVDEHYFTSTGGEAAAERRAGRSATSCRIPLMRHASPPDHECSEPIMVQGIPVVFVLDVAITLTMGYPASRSVTKTVSTETKALLNVSPRNVFNTWALASIGYTDRIQSAPATVAALLAVP